MNESLEKQLNSLKSSPASDPHPEWVASLRAKLEWTMARGNMPALPPLRQTRSFVWFRRPLAVASLSLALLLLVGGGITYAAQGALPGSILYTVKLASENVRVKLAADDTTRTAIELQLADRRMEEFRVLSSQEKITPETAAALTTRYESHVSAALQALPTLPPATVPTLTESITNAVNAHIVLATSFEAQNTVEEEQHDEPSPSQENEEENERKRARKELRERMKKQKEEVRKQAERMRAFARESRDAALLLKETTKNQDLKLEVKVEEDAEGRAHVKINAERKKNGKEEKKKIEFTVPSSASTATEVVVPLFDDHNGDTPTSSPPFNLPFNNSTFFNFNSRIEGSGSVNQEIKTEIKSETKVEIRSGSSTHERGGKEDD